MTPSYDMQPNYVGIQLIIMSITRYMDTEIYGTP